MRQSAAAAVEYCITATMQMQLWKYVDSVLTYCAAVRL